MSEAVPNHLCSIAMSAENLPPLLLYNTLRGHPLSCPLLALDWGRAIEDTHQLSEGSIAKQSLHNIYLFTNRAVSHHH